MYIYHNCISPRRLAKPMGLDCFLRSSWCFCCWSKASFYSLGFLSSPGNLESLVNMSSLGREAVSFTFFSSSSFFFFSSSSFFSSFFTFNFSYCYCRSCNYFLLANKSYCCFSKRVWLLLIVLLL